MDYEKKYNEALNWMRDLYPSLYGATKEDAEHYFPELRESEDERIRKELKEAFEAYDIESRWNGIPIRSIFAWLEKQKEQKPTQTNAEKEYVRTIKGIIADFVRDNQPKDVAFYQKIYDWLDGRHIEQKPTEWSEEDEEHIKSLLARLEGMCKKGATFTQTRFAVSQDRDWLKSLRPDSYKNCNSRWKPLPESMEALLLAIEGKWDAIKPTGYMSRRLEDLYDGLVNTFDVDENYQRNSYGKEIH